MNGKYEIGDYVLSNWKLVKELGAGAFGKVYEAHRDDFGVIYKAAIKIITIPQTEGEILSAQSEGMTDEEVSDYFRSMVKQIMNECAFMSKVKGVTNIVGYEDHVVIPHEKGIGWDIIIRMELLKPLLVYVKQHAMTLADTVKLGIDICKALEVCKKMNVIHRDVKPENIMISELGNYKLGDFGISRTLESTQSGLSKKGTVSYMAPEVAKGEPYGPTVDIYSLGIVMYRFLNDNRAPFLPKAPTPITYQDRETALEKRLNGEAFPMPVQADEELGRIVLKACAYRARDRYSTPTEFRKDLEAWAEKAGIDIEQNPFGQNDINIKMMQEAQGEKERDGERTLIALSTEEPEGILKQEESINIASQSNELEEQNSDVLECDQTDIESEENSQDEEEDRTSAGPERAKSSKNKTWVIWGGVAVIALLVLGGIFWKIQNNKPTSEEVISSVSVQDEREMGSLNQNVEGRNAEEKSEVVVTIPSVLMKTEEQAKDILEDLGLVVNVDYQYDGYTKGWVVYQSVSQGTEVLSGTDINLTVTLGDLYQTEEYKLAQTYITNGAENYKKAIEILDTLKGKQVPSEIAKLYIAWAETKMDLENLDYDDALEVLKEGYGKIKDDSLKEAIAKLYIAWAETVTDSENLDYDNALEVLKEGCEKIDDDSLKEAYENVLTKKEKRLINYENKVFGDGRIKIELEVMEDHTVHISIRDSILSTKYATNSLESDKFDIDKATQEWFLLLNDSSQTYQVDGVCIEKNGKKKMIKKLYFLNEYARFEPIGNIDLGESNLILEFDMKKMAGANSVCYSKLSIQEFAQKSSNGGFTLYE